MSDNPKILKDRTEINKIDKEIIKLINQRVEHVLNIGKEKKENNISIYRPDRELEIYKSIEELNQNNKFPTNVLINIYREIISACRALEAPTDVAFLGPEATNTHLAAIKQFGSSCNFMPFKTIADVFKEVETGL